MSDPVGYIKIKAFSKMVVICGFITSLIHFFRVEMLFSKLATQVELWDMFRPVSQESLIFEAVVLELIYCSCEGLDIETTR